MKFMPEISVILPVFNGEEYLEDAIESILKQTFTDYELIVIDDCSNDSTPSILQGFSKRDPRIKLYRNNQNLNLPKSLNKGHAIAKGKFITWTSDDNILKPFFLETLVVTIKKNNVDVVFSDFDIINSSGKFLRLQEAGPVCALPFGNFIGASFMYKSEVYNVLKFNDASHGIEDYDFWLRAAIQFRFHRINQSLYKYRIHPKSLTSEIARDDDFSHLFISRLNLTLNQLKDILKLDSKTVKVLMGFQNHNYWDWNYFFKHTRIFKRDIKIWQNKLKTNDQLDVFKYLEIILRKKALNTSNRKSLLRLIFYNPQIVFGKNYSKRGTLSIVRKLLTLK